MTGKCVFFDRDGIVNRSPGPGYVERWEDFELIPEFIDVVRLAGSRGYEAAIVTNQRCVALGRITRDALDDIHGRLVSLLSDEYGVNILGVFACTHDRGECDCRKPKPGLLLKVAGLHGIDLSRSWMIGDQSSDIEAGRAAGCRTILVSRNDTDVAPDFRTADMVELQTVVAKVL